MRNTDNSNFYSTACILCSLNCGLKIEVENDEFVSIHGDKEHPNSQGYLCQKAARLNFYQNHTNRLKHPLRKTSDGAHEKISWDTAIDEVANKLLHIRNTYGGHSIAYYGGGGQGNHMCQIYSSSFRSALNTPYLYTSLAQEKTGDFWINGKLFGKQSCHIAEDIEHSDYVLIIGANPWQAHGIPRARKVLGQISRDPNRTLVVIDPRLTKTARLADHYLQVIPGMDAFLLAAILAVIVQEGLEDAIFIKEHTIGFAEIRNVFKKIAPQNYAEKAGVDFGVVKKIALDFAKAKNACVRVDLGLQQNLHSTLNSYLEKLLFLVTGNFGKKGSNNLHTQFVPIVGHSKEVKNGGVATKVTGMGAISNFYPPNILPAEINTDNPERVRALIVDSSNPIVTAADSNAYRKAFEKLELVVVIDVAKTETAELADYILPAQSQFEKWEASFFTLEFPTNYFHLRQPIAKPQGDTLAEPEIYRRLMVAMGSIPDRFPILEKIAKLHFRFPSFGLFPVVLKLILFVKPKLKKYVLMILYTTLGKALPNKAQNAAMLWGASYLYARKYRKQVLRAGISAKGSSLGESFFNRILESKSGLAISTHTYEEVWELIQHPDKKIHLAIPEMIKVLSNLSEELSQEKKDTIGKKHTFILAAGERRSYNANQIYREPKWRKDDPDGALRIHPEDAIRISLTDGGMAECESSTDKIKVIVQFDNAMRQGFVSLPHGYGFNYTNPDKPELIMQNGPRINLLTSSTHCDPISKTPYHKCVPVRLSPIK